jgi:hypothetical protein
MTLQTKATVLPGQGYSRLGTLALSLLAATACGGSKRDAEGAVVPSSAATFATQPLDADPCGWVAPADVAALLDRKLRGVPVRVSSAESITPSATGAGCMYELEPKGGERSGMLALEVKIQAVEMQAGLGAPNLGDFASAEGKWTAKWDWVSGLPAGLFAARQGHVGVLIANDVALGSKEVEPLAARVLAKLPDLPFANAPTDPALVANTPDPCSLITRAEAESVLGTLSFPPFRSRESTPVACGRGKSCTYYTAGHRVVVLTPTQSEGKQLFDRMRGIAGLTGQMTGERPTTSTAEPWDERTTGVAGTQYFLKGDRLLELQYRASTSEDAVAARLARIAVARL